MLSKEDAFLVTAFTGKMCIDSASFHEMVEKELDRPVFTHEMADNRFWEFLKDSVRDRFVEICYKGERNGKIS